MYILLDVYKRQLTLSMKAQYHEYEFTGHEATLFVLKRYVKLVLSFTLPFLFCMGVTYLTHTSRYSDGFPINLINAGMDFLGLGHLFGTVSYTHLLAMEVRKVLDVNKQERHIRGGLATKEKYLHMVR